MRCYFFDCLRQQTTIYFAILISLSIWIDVTHATGEVQQNSVYADMLPGNLLALPGLELDEKVPAILLLAAQDGANPKMRPMLAIRLGTLMYPASADFDLAVKDFQSDLGAAPTGSLTVGQLSELDYRSAFSKLEYVKLRAERLSWRFDQVMRIQGSLRGYRNEVAHPINRVQVVCYKDVLFCSFELLELQVPTRDSLRRGYRINLRNKWRSQILEWEKDYMVLARKSDDSCAQYHLELNFDSQSFRERPVNKTEECVFWSSRSGHIQFG